MKLIKFLVLSFVVVLASASCLREPQRLLNVIKDYEFSVIADLPSIEQESETKGYLGSFASATWTKGDKVSVVNLTTGKILGGSLTSDKTGTRATFSGTVTGTISQGDKLALFYPPFELEAESEFATQVVNLSEQSASANVPLVGYSTFSADGNTYVGVSTNFDYILSYLKINMANLPAGSNVSKISIRNIPTQCSVSINSQNTGFDVATPDEKSAKSIIVLNGPFTIAPTGALSVSIGVMPSDQYANRTILVTADDGSEYLSPLTSAKLVSQKYYNTVASQFELATLPGYNDYGIYNTTLQTVIDTCSKFDSTLITGTEATESDFTLLNSLTNSYWKIRGIPSDVYEGSLFPARVYSYGIDYPSEVRLDSAKVIIIDPDGDFSKLWIKQGDYLFIVRK